MDPAPRTIRALLVDYTGTLTMPLAPVMDGPVAGLREVLFGEYHLDGDHPVHRIERGEMSLLEFRVWLDAEAACHQVGGDALAAILAPWGELRHDLIDEIARARRAGLRTALVTNSVRELADRLAAAHPWHDVFDVVVDSSAIGMRKPDPRVFLHALEQLGDVEAREALVIDDFECNTAAAASLGMATHLVSDDRGATIATVRATYG